MTQVLFHFLSPIGEAIADTPFVIHLERSDQDEADSGIILPRVVNATTDADGKAIVSLAPTLQRYHVTLVDRDGNAALHHDFYVPVVNNPDAVVALEDIVVPPNAQLSGVAYDEAAMLLIIQAKGETLAARDQAVAAIDSIQEDADAAITAAEAAYNSQIAAQNAFNGAFAMKGAVEGLVQYTEELVVLAEDHEANALQSKTDAAASAADAASALTAAQGSAAAALASENAAQSSEEVATAARDAASFSATSADAAKTASETARDITIAARDITTAARDVTTAARDTAVDKANQLASQLYAFNEIYIGKFAVAPTTDGNGNPLKVGAIYENTVEGKIFQWESDLAWHPYDEESQAQLNSAILSANNAASSAGAALASQNAAAGSATAANTSAANAEASNVEAEAHEAAALASKQAAELAETNAETAAGIATTKAAEAAQSAAEAAISAEQALDGQLPSNWAETDPGEKTYIQNKPVLAAVATSGLKADVGLGNVDNTSDANKPVSTAQASALALKEAAANKDASGGYAGLTQFKLNLKNVAGAIVSFLVSSATAARTWTFPDKDGTVAMLSDITGTNSGVNTGDETGASIRTKVGATALTGSNTGDETNATILSKLGIPSISGTNTGDETNASIKTKLGAATSAVAGYLLSVDWVRFDAKQAALGFTPIDAATRGQANGVATLGADGKVPAAQLPGYVDDVLEYANYGALPATGTSGVMYVTINDGILYRWSGSAYVIISASPGSTDAVPEGVVNKYFTDSRVLAAVLTGFSAVTNAAVTAADNVLSALGKLQKQLTDLKTGIGASGTWAINITGNSAMAAALSNFLVAGRSTQNMNQRIANGMQGLEDLPVNAPPGSNYGAMIIANNLDTGLQIVGGYQSDNLWFRGYAGSGSSFTAWRKVIHDGNIAAQSVFSATYATSAVSASKADKLQMVSGSAGGTTFNWSGASGQPTWLVGGNDSLNLYVYNPLNFSVNDSANLGSVSSTKTMQKRRGEVGNNGPSMNAIMGGQAEYGFAYQSDGSLSGPFIQFGGLGASDGNYMAQFSLNYGDGSGFRFRTRNDDAGVNNPWRDVWHTGNMNSPSVSAVANTLVQRNTGGYIEGNYLNMTDDVVTAGVGVPGVAVTGIMVKRGDNYYRTSNAANVKTYLNYVGAEITTNRLNFATFIGCAKELAWNYFGNGHTIIDASSGVAPGGASISSTTATNPWQSSYPMLVGWNGGQTYGVRVDSSARADAAAYSTRLTLTPQYTWQAANPPTWYGNGITTSFVSSGEGWGSYYNIVNIKGYDNGHGAGMQLRIPYGDANGGTKLCFRLSDNAIGDAWQGWETIPTLELPSTWTSDQSFSSGGNVTQTSPISRFQSYSTGGAASGISFHRGGNYGLNFGLDSDNVVRIGGWSNPNGGLWSLDMSGNMLAAGNVTAYSDERLKDDWKPMTTDFVERWAKVKAGSYNRIDSGERQVGVSAQDAQKVMPPAVSMDGEYLMLAYGQAAAVATVELAKRVVQQDEEIKYLKARIAHQDGNIEACMKLVLALQAKQ